MKLLTKDVGKLLDKSPQTVQDYADRGQLKAERTPNGTRIFDEDDVKRFGRELEKKKKK